MSDAFQERERGFERKYELDQERAFRVHARRDRLFGRWATNILGIRGSASDTYVKNVVEGNLEIPGDEDMLTKVRNDFAALNITVSDNELRRQLSQCHLEALNEIAAERY